MGEIAPMRDGGRGRGGKAAKQRKRKRDHGKIEERMLREPRDPGVSVEEVKGEENKRQGCQIRVRNNLGLNKSDIQIKKFTQILFEL